MNEVFLHAIVYIIAKVGEKWSAIATLYEFAWETAEKQDRRSTKTKTEYHPH